MGWRARIAAGLALACSHASLTATAPSEQSLVFVASYYSEDYKGTVASGVPYDPTKLTAAHRTLPFGTQLRITNPETKRSVEVIVNDRGPFVADRMLDVSLAAAKELQIIERGVVSVTVTLSSKQRPATPMADG